MSQLQRPAEAQQTYGAALAGGLLPPPVGEGEPSSNGIYTDGSAWAERAEELADFFWQFVNRTDAWGGYRAMEERGKPYKGRDGKEKKFGRSLTRKGRLTRGGHLVRHFRATAPEHIVGLHSTSPQNTSRTGAVDIDWHGPGSTAPQVNRAAGLAWYRRLVVLELAALLTESNGEGGCHLELLLGGPLPTPLMFYFVRWLIRDYAAYGMTAPPETFPKQPRVKPPGQKGQYGNWLRLPGRHHSKPYWSRVWDGSEFVSGEQAVEFVLSLKPSDPRHVRKALADIFEPRVRDYRAKVPNLGEAQGRDDVAYRYGCWLARDLWLDDETALKHLGEWDRDNKPPKGDERLREILDNVHQYGQEEYGCGLDDPLGPRKPRGRKEGDRNTEPAPARVFPLGSVTLKPGAARRTKGGKLVVQVALLKGDKQVNLFPLNDSLGGRKDAEKLIKSYLAATDPAEGAIQGALGELLVYSAECLDNRPAEEGPLLRDLVFNRVQEQFKVTHRTEVGLWSETLGEVRRAEFVTHCPEWLVIAAAECRGMPRDINGEPVRHDIARAIEAELKILYATLRERLPLAADIPGDKSLEDTEAARRFKTALLLCWTKICTAEHLKVPEGEDASRRASLIRRVQTAAEPYLGNEARPPQGVGWQRAHPSYSAWWRPWRDDQSGEVRLYLALRWDLPDQVGVPLPGVRDGHTLARLGRRFGVTDPDPSVTPSLAKREARLTVLSREVTDYLLAEPGDAPQG
jgi:hypothetical protein